jgi:hypothetical protein
MMADAITPNDKIVRVPYVQPASCRDTILATPGHEPEHRMQTPRQPVLTGEDSGAARVLGKPIPFPHRRFAPGEHVPLPAEMRGRSKRVCIV